MKKLIAIALLLTATAAFGRNDVADKSNLKRTFVPGGTEYIEGNIGKLPPGQAKKGNC